MNRCRGAFAANPSVRWARIVVVCCTAAMAVAIGGCGSAPESSQSSTTSAARPASYPTSAEETGAQTLRRARAYYADQPALDKALEQGVSVCGSAELLDLARRYGSTADPLSLGAAYSQNFTNRERRETAALGCYLGATVRLEQNARRPNAPSEG